MTKRILVVIGIGIAIAALIALAWWWFFSRPNNVPKTPKGLGSAQNRTLTQSGSNTNGDSSSSVIPKNQTATKIAAGKYTLETLDGTKTGTYQVAYSSQQSINLDNTVSNVSDNSPQTVTITPVDNSKPLSGGDYTFTTDGIAVGNYEVTPFDSLTGTDEFTIEPYDLGGGTTEGTNQGTTTLAGYTPPTYVSSTTGPGDFFIEPPIEFPPVITTGGGGTGGTNTTITSGNATSSGSGLGSSITFNPKNINTIFSNDANSYNYNTGVLPNIGGSSNSSSGGLGLGGTILAAAGAGALSCGAAQAFAWGAAAFGFSTGATAGASFTTAGIGASGLVNGPRIPISVQTIDLGPGAVLSVGTNPILSSLNALAGGSNGEEKATDTTNTFWGCLARTIAKIAIQQITNSVVNWINSGFNGSPSFVTNPTQFFTNIADNAAGEFIKGTGLAFLCSPFSLQIKIAIAQSYANRNANSCSLTKIIGNVNSFMNGNFSSGGWQGLLSFTGNPTNNPYGAYVSGSISLKYAVETAKGTQQRELNLGNGFLDFKKKEGCINTTQPPSDGSPGKSIKVIDDDGRKDKTTTYEVCNLISTTPGKVIQESLSKTLGTSLDSLNLAKSFDEIISALITQLMTRALQGGVSNLSGSNGYASTFYTPDQLATQNDAQSVVLRMQADSQTAQNYAGVEQGSIQDIQATQQKLTDVVNCWNTIATASSTNASFAATTAREASTTIANLDNEVDGYNSEIARANTTITTLIDLQNNALSAASTADTSAASTAYTNANAQGKLITQTDLTTAQQNRTTLQSRLQTINADSAQSLSTCNETQ